MVPILRRFLLINLNCKYYSSISLGGENAAKILYKHLMRQCNKLPEGPKQHYKFMVKQSFKQHINETDALRIQQIIKRSYEDADWVLKKYLEEKK